MPPDDDPSADVDISLLLNNNQIRFTQSVRRHLIGRARVMTVLATCAYVEIQQGAGTRLLWVGEDWTGRQLEVIAVLENRHLVVIHAMDARPKLVRLYAERIRRGNS